MKRGLVQGTSLRMTGLSSIDVPLAAAIAALPASCCSASAAICCRRSRSGFRRSAGRDRLAGDAHAAQCRSRHAVGLRRRLRADRDRRRHVQRVASGLAIVRCRDRTRNANANSSRPGPSGDLNQVAMSDWNSKPREEPGRVRPYYASGSLRLLPGHHDRPGAGRRQRHRHRPRRRGPARSISAPRSS